MVEVLQSFIGHGYILQRDTTRPSLATRFAQDYTKKGNKEASFRDPEKSNATIKT